VAPRFLLPLVAALLGLALLSQYGHALRGPFVGDDYLFLEKTRHMGFLALWEPRALAFHYYRPWSREFHYWVLTRIFGPQVFPFHLTSLALALGALVLYFQFARRVAGSPAAAVATVAVASLAAWGALMVWAAGSQDLWMLVFALAGLLALASGRLALATVCQVLALLSKETAAILPAVALSYCLIVERRGLRAAVARTAALWGVAALWAALHPLLGGRMVHPIREAAIAGLHQPLTSIVAHTVLALVNLDRWPRPDQGWGRALLASVPGTVLLAGLVVWGLGTRLRRNPGKPGGTEPFAVARVAAFGATWGIVAWLPLMLPSLGWHAYYAMFGFMGMWLALGAVLARWPKSAIAVVLALSLLRTGRATTPSHDWGDEWFQRRAAGFGAYTRDFLLSRYPALPPNSRVYLANVPSGVGLIPGGEESPALRVWYGDASLQTHFLSRYRRRAAGEPRGNDYFFTFDETGGWRQIEIGPPMAGAPALRDSGWVPEHRDLMMTMLAAEDWQAARSEGEKLAAAAPDRAMYPYDVAVCCLRLGDVGRAASWFARAAALPDASAAMKAVARRYASPAGGGNRARPGP